jgi:hypothetical protein
MLMWLSLLCFAGAQFNLHRNQYGKHTFAPSSVLWRSWCKRWTLGNNVPDVLGRCSVSSWWIVPPSPWGRSRCWHPALIIRHSTFDIQNVQRSTIDTQHSTFKIFDIQQSTLTFNIRHWHSTFDIDNQHSTIKIFDSWHSTFNIRHSKHSTFNMRHSTIKIFDIQHSTFDIQLSTFKIFDIQHSTFDIPYSTSWFNIQHM